MEKKLLTANSVSYSTAQPVSLSLHLRSSEHFSSWAMSAELPVWTGVEKELEGQEQRTILPAWSWHLKNDFPVPVWMSYFSRFHIGHTSACSFSLPIQNGNRIIIISVTFPYGAVIGFSNCLLHRWRIPWPSEFRQNLTEVISWRQNLNKLPGFLMLQLALVFFSPF